jgi:hypothetical protein
MSEKLVYHTVKKLLSDEKPAAYENYTVYVWWRNEHGEHAARVNAGRLLLWPHSEYRFMRKAFAVEVFPKRRRPEQPIKHDLVDPQEAELLPAITNVRWSDW